jgi:hypothetical protein
MNFKLMGILVSRKPSHVIIWFFLFTKPLPYCTFSKCIAGIGMYRLRDLQDLVGALS